jgi:putative hydrolase of HD superfamily
VDHLLGLSMDADDDLAGIYDAVLRLKGLRRAGWLERGVGDAESVAAHSYAVALLSMILADIRGLDAAEAMRMALIHDLPEAFIGDLTPGEKERMRDLREREMEAIVEMAKTLPGGASERLVEAWRRYSDGSSEVARLVRDIDKLEMGLQALNYIKSGYSGVWEIYMSALREIGDPKLRELLRRLGEGLA